jgi:hypothetical protein
VKEEEIVIDPERIKSRLLDPDRWVQAAAVDYFARTWSRDPEIAGLLLEGIERASGGAVQMLLDALARFQSFPTAESLSVAALCSMEAPDPEALLEKLGREDESPVNNPAIETLRRIGGEDVVAAIASEVRGRPERWRRDASLVLSGIPLRASEELLLWLLERETDSDMLHHHTEGLLALFSEKAARRSLELLRCGAYEDVIGIKSSLLTVHDVLGWEFPDPDWRSKREALLSYPAEARG